VRGFIFIIMAKDTFYFSHDFNARSDDKIKMLIRKHGILGYGTYWAIIEDLYNNANALRLDCDGIAFDLRVDCEVVKSVLNDFDLFVFDGEIFGSISVERRLDERNSKSAKARDSANKRWGKIKDDANALRTHCDGNAIKERKGKEIKEIKESVNKFTPPTFQEVILIITDKKEAEAFLDLYKSNGWMVGKNKMKDWEAAARNWLRRKVEFSKPPQKTGKLNFDPKPMGSDYDKRKAFPSVVWPEDIIK